MFGSTSAPSFGFGTQSASSGSTPSFGSSFGSSAPSFRSSTNAPAFGSPAGQSTSVFGSSAPTFGSTSTSAPAFGSSSLAPSFGSSSAPSFGSSSAPAFGSTSSAPAFGSTSSAPSFGSSSSAPAFGSGGASSSMFGPSSSAPAFGSAGGGAPSFGSSSAPAFGSTNTAPAFGSAAPSFGSSSIPPLGFGSTSSAPAFGSGGSFGGGAFGASFGSTAKPTTGLGFGTSVPSFGDFGGSSFGSFGQGGVPQGAAGGATGGLFGQQMVAQPQPAVPLNPIFQALQKIASAYAPLIDPTGRRFVSEREVGAANRPACPKNEECKFKAIYILKKEDWPSPQQSALLMSNPLFEEAERMNIDPDRYVPVELAGAEALGQRFEAQGKELEKLNGQTEKVKGILKAAQEANAQLEAKYLLLASRQHTLMRQLLQMMRKLEVLRCQGAPVQENEMKFKERMQSLLNKLQAPYKQLQELSMALSLQARQEDRFEERVCEEDVEALVGALKRQSEGLESLAEMMRRDLRDMELMRSKLSGRYQL